MSSLTSDEIEAYCHNLVRKVAYAFYEQPYILLFQQLLVHGVCEENELADRLGKLNKHDLRKYLGFLRNHRLVNVRLHKTPMAPTDKGYAFANFRRGQPQDDNRPRTKDVNYYWIDYREFANVTKYRLAMMRREIEQKSQQSVVSRGYICPACEHKYAALEVTSLLDPRTGLLICEACDEHPEVQEYDPNADLHGEPNEDQMLKFNNATRDIQDALRLLEPVTIPSLNMDAWLAMNVRSAVVGQDGKPVEDVRDVKVKIGDEGDEKERIEKARLAEAQRIQNALPEWVTHSTVTGGATALGLDAQRRVDNSSAAAMARGSANGLNGDADEHDYYGNMDGSDDEEDDDMEDSKPAVSSAFEGGVKEETEEERDGEDGYTDDGYTPMPSAPGTPVVNGASGGDAVMVMVAGVAKPIEEVTDEDENDLMTEEEREAYAAILSEM